MGPGKTMKAIVPEIISNGYLYRIALFSVVPIIWLTSWYGLTDERGPFHRLQDPDYIYLLNSLSIANGYSPHHVDHPGTVLQLIGAAVLSVSQVWNSSADLTFSVLSNPETYLMGISLLIAALGAVCAFTAGIYVHAQTGSRFVAVTFQAGIISSPTLLLVSIRVMPEPILLILSMCSLMVYVYVAGNSERQINSLFAALLLAMLAGIGMATKITFLPYLIIPIIILPRILPRIVYVFGSVVVFYISTIPIHHHFDYILHWVKSIIFHLGRYGHGEAGVIDVSNFSQNIKSIFQSEPFMALCLFIAIAWLIICIVKRRNGYCRGEWWKLMLAMVAALIVQIVMVAKHPGDNRYLIPSLTLCAPLCAVIYLHFRSLDINLSKLSGSTIVTFFYFSMIIPLFTYDYAEYIKSNKTESSVYGALYHFADYWAGNRYRDIIQKIHSN